MIVNQDLTWDNFHFLLLILASLLDFQTNLYVYLKKKFMILSVSVNISGHRGLRSFSCISHLCIMINNQLITKNRLQCCLLTRIFV